MQKIVDTMIYLEIKKIELKLNYLNSFEKAVEYKRGLIKNLENQIIQDRIKINVKRLQNNEEYKLKEKELTEKHLENERERKSIIEQLERIKDKERGVGNGKQGERKEDKMDVE